VARKNKAALYQASAPSSDILPSIAHKNTGFLSWVATGLERAFRPFFFGPVLHCGPMHNLKYFSAYSRPTRQQVAVVLLRSLIN
jgi:hypothetical protein